MIGVANGHSTITPCNSGLQKLADAAIAGIEEAVGNTQVFGTPTISDGMAKGTEGIETCVQGQWMDGVLVIGGCDKNMPGGLMGMPTCRPFMSMALLSCPAPTREKT